MGRGEESVEWHLTPSLIGRLTWYVIYCRILPPQQMLPLNRAGAFRGQKVFGVSVACLSCVTLTIYMQYTYTLYSYLYNYIYTYVIYIYIYMYIYIHTHTPLLFFTFITLQNISSADSSALSPYNTIANYSPVRLGKEVFTR